MDYVGKPTFLVCLLLAVVVGMVADILLTRAVVVCEIRSHNLASKIVVCPNQDHAFKLVPIEIADERCKPAKDDLDAGAMSVPGR